FHRFRRKRNEVPDIAVRAGETGNPNIQQEADGNIHQGQTLRHSVTSRSRFPSSHIRDGNNVAIRVEARPADPSYERRADPLGLNILYEPTSQAAVDIVFVHGLGGSSRQSWSKDRNPELFWPQQWLPNEPIISAARIFSFGYNAAFQSTSTGRNNILNVSDFAKDLLYSMRFATGDGEKQLKMGQLPIIFVAHSMGGLVVKKALILGQCDPHYKDIVQTTRAVLFLSTPHRGTNLAVSLNRILTVSIFGHSAKQYISELENNSLTLQDINEQFRSFAPRLTIFSFFETFETTVGPIKMMVLQKESSILGYPGEISKPLNADHHDVCKFTSPKDPNYLSVRSALCYLLEQFRSDNTVSLRSRYAEERRKIESLLSMFTSSIEDCDFYLEKRFNGSCGWFLTNRTFRSWLVDDAPASRILLCKGRPGSGKSVLAAVVVEHLQNLNHNCSFYFFRFGDQTKRTISGFLHSIAYQISDGVPDFRRRLLQLIDNGLDITKSNSKAIWQKLFMSVLFKLSNIKPVYLVVDALDECEMPALLLKLFADIPASKVPIRIIVFSRDNYLLSTLFETALKAVPVTFLSVDDSRDDLRLYVTEEIRSMRGEPIFKEQMAAKIFEKAEGNFLWVHLVIQEILQCHTQGAVLEALNNIPADLEALYERMHVILEKSLRPADLAMSRTILLWVTCARRSLTLAELDRALQPEYPLILDLKSTVSQVCGEFVVVDNLSQISMVHSTAREYLIKSLNSRLGVSVAAAHQHLFMKCLTVLVEPGVRSQVEQFASPSFLLYAAISWPYHLELTAAPSDEAFLILLVKFFRGSFILTWIHILAIAGQLQILLQVSKILNAFIANCNKVNADRNSATHRLQERELLAHWATDLTHIVGKFGLQLMRHPKSVYALVPSFCPHESVLFEQFGSKQALSSIRISGFSNAAWDDCLAKFAIGGRNIPLGIFCLNQYFSIVMSNGVVILYRSSTCEEAWRFSHGERVLKMCHSTDGEKLVTCGLFTTKVWSVISARQLHSFVNPSRAKALAVSLKTDGDTLMVFSEDRVVRCISLNNADNGWKIYENVFGEVMFEGRQYNSPQNVSFSPDSNQIAVSFRGFPLSIWGVENPRPRLIGRIKRHGDRGERREGAQSKYTDVQTMCWNPITKHILGTYNDGCFFKWHPFENDYQESKILAVNIKCSSNGCFFITSTVDGGIKIWDFQRFSLIYQLSCPSSVTDLAIDPDNRRIYDLRDTFCTIWEPNVLLRLYGAGEMASDTTSTNESLTMIPMASETSVEMPELVTAISVNPQTLQCAVGNDEGGVRLFGVDGELIMELSQGFMTVEHIVWSEDGNLVAIADLSRRINIEYVNHKDMTSPLRSVLTIKEEDTIQKIIFNSSTDLLLVCTAGFLKLWSLETMASTMTWPQTVSGTFWAAHPLNNALLLGFGFTSIQVCTWAGLQIENEVAIDRTTIDIESDKAPQESMRRRISAPLPVSPREDENRVDKVWLTSDDKQALVETSSATPQGRRKKQFMLIALAHLPMPDSSETETEISAVPLPADLLARIEMPFGFLSNDIRRDRRQSSLKNGEAGSSLTTSENTLVFLDREFWVCTWSFSDSGIESRVRRHFFLPQDWLNMECLELAIIRSDGTLVCPKNGEVALVWNGLKEEWIE
ncbi:hypothetical protein MMC17_009630, partial [Xylographa soralifera]|nr:hypothetical protein [Xylographa soralifera]